ncbi:uncharacterized protein BKA78DRAFT_337937, partial [Phyllosticta capitalensis]|uniref:uncharacterized protein n=1 Tax=Phyllosticta capitalensis TaxID=121624 RepID=UPI00312E0C28
RCLVLGSSVFALRHLPSATTFSRHAHSTPLLHVIPSLAAHLSHRPPAPVDGCA